jgi:addiction module RelB/DinJ family antitoxin
MAKTVLNVKTDVEVKREAQKLAKEIGVPLSTIVNAHLKQFISDRRVEFSAPLIPSARLRAVIEEAENDLKIGNTEAFSPRFSTAEDAIRWLEDTEA